MISNFKTQRTRWGAVALLAVFVFSFASITVPFASNVKFTKQIGLTKTEKSNKLSGQLPFEGKEKETESGTENIQEVVDYTNSWLFTERNLLVSLIIYCAPRSCGDVTNLPLYLAKRVLLL